MCLGCAHGCLACDLVRGVYRPPYLPRGRTLGLDVTLCRFVVLLPHHLSFFSPFFFLLFLVNSPSLFRPPTLPPGDGSCSALFVSVFSATYGVLSDKSASLESAGKLLDSTSLHRVKVRLPYRKVRWSMLTTTECTEIFFYVVRACTDRSITRFSVHSCT